MKLAILLLTTVTFAAPEARIFAQSAAPTQAWGPSAQGLRMGIVLKPAEQSPAGGELFVAFENISQSDFVLNLGIMLANGRVMLPTGIRLSVTAPDGTTKEFVFSDRRYGGIAGRVDDFVVSLRAGSTYTLRLTLDQFLDPVHGRLSLPSAAGNRIVARFESHPPRTSNLDMQGIALLNFWKGNVQSNVVEF